MVPPIGPGSHSSQPDTPPNPTGNLRPGFGLGVVYPARSMVMWPVAGSMSPGMLRPAPPIRGNWTSVATTSSCVTVHVAGVACTRGAASASAAMRNTCIVLRIVASPLSGLVLLLLRLLRQREDVLLAR